LTIESCRAEILKALGLPQDQEGGR
jgi:hypothetical protein